MPVWAVRWSRKGRLCPAAENERANVTAKELRALKLLAKELLSYSKASLAKATKAGELIEIEVGGNG
jgi:hypothetical protein